MEQYTCLYPSYMQPAVFTADDRWVKFEDAMVGIQEERERIGLLVHDIGRTLLSGSADDQIRGAYCLVLAMRIRSNQLDLEGALRAHGITPPGGPDGPPELDDPGPD